MAEASGSTKTLKGTDIVDNPLHQFASWTYSWSLWWLDVNDYRAITSGADPAQALSAPLSKSYVIAQDGGVYPQQRAPSQAGLTYNIQKVELKTTVSSNKNTRSSNLISGTLTVVEPHGVTWLDSIIQLSFNPTAGTGGAYQNYTQQPYMLQLDFVGYDDRGEPIPTTQSNALYRKRFPIIIKSIKVNVTQRGAEYVVDFAPAAHEALINEKITVPEEMTITAGTVQEFFDEFANQLNEIYRGRVAKLQGQYADIFNFKIDPEIGRTKIVYEKNMPLGAGDPESANLKLSKGKFTIPPGMHILSMITKVVAQSEFIIKQLGLNFFNASTEAIQTAVTDKLKVFKTTCKVDFAGADKDGNPTEGAFDNILNYRPKRFTYNIVQFTAFNNSDPSAGTLADPRPFVAKRYNYTYTGQNRDVVNFRLNLDTTYYTQVMGATSSIASTLATSNTGLNNVLLNYPNPLLSPQLVASSLVPQLLQRPDATPQRYSVIVNDLNITTGFRVGDDPAAQKAAKLVKTVEFSDANMLTADVTIVGDPTLLKQDDWLYSPDPTNPSNEWNKWDQISNSDYVAKYGHLRMDVSHLLVDFVINTPLDIDTDWAGTGLVFPQPGLYKSLFSGVYYIQEIVSRFENGKFEQVLRMKRTPFSTLTTSAAPESPISQRLSGGTNNLYVVPKGYNSVTINQINQSSTYNR